MTNDIRDKIMLSLGEEFTIDQLRMIDLAVAEAMRGYRVEQEETLPSIYQSAVPIEVQEFLVRKKMKGCAVGTLRAYRDVLRDFSEWLDKDIKNVRDTDILAYLAWRSRDNGNRTLDGKRRVLSSFYTYMHDCGKISTNPIKTVDRIKYKENVRQPLTDMELERVRMACTTPREKALFEVYYSTGCRVCEALGIDYPNINTQERSVVVCGKGNKERYVFFNAKALIAIEEYLKTRTDDNPALFVCSRRPYNRMGKNTAEAVIRRIGERSGVGRRVFPHLLRHTMATDMLFHGAQINEVQHILGHSKTETTQIYAKTSPTSISQAHRRYIA